MTTHTRRVLAFGAAIVLTSAAIAGGVLLYRARQHAHGHAEQGVEYFCPMHPQIARDKPGECPICGMKLEKRTTGGTGSPSSSSSTQRRILYYRHAMDPSIHSEAPAKDDMGMDYVPVYADEASAQPVPGRATVTLPSDRIALLGIRSEPVGSGSRGGPLRTIGRVAVDETRREVVHAKYEGYIEKLLVDFTGQPVRKGQPLAAIYSPELVAAQEEYLVARRAEGRLAASTIPGVASGGSELAEAARERLRYWDVSAGEIASLESSGRPRRTVTLRSPVSGVVVEKAAVEGMKVVPTDRLYEITDLSRVWVVADVYEKDLGLVRIGTSAEVKLPHAPGARWLGKVNFVSPAVKPETRTVEVRIEVDNGGGALKPDMLADVYLETPRAAALTVPESAVIFTGERTLVFLDRGEGRFEPRAVTVGARVPGGYEVLGGVATGDRVVVSANFLLDSESSLRAAAANAGAR